MNTDGIIKDLTSLEYLFRFNNSSNDHEIFSNKNNKEIGKFNIDIPKKIWIDEFNFLRSKAYSFKFEYDIEGKNKLKGISKSQ